MKTLNWILNKLGYVIKHVRVIDEIDFAYVSSVVLGGNGMAGSIKKDH